MEKNNVALQRQNLLFRLSCLPEKIISAHDRDNLIEFILYEICHPECFNFQRAAFLIDNPDFNCLKGIAGFCAQEHSTSSNIWESPELFSQNMQQGDFNNSVRSIQQTSLQKINHLQESLPQISQQLALTNPSWHIFTVKHGNTGILLFEQPSQDIHHEHVPAGAALLALCPIW